MADEMRELPDGIALGSGSHDGPDDGMCVMEAAAWIAGEPWSDHPVCVSPVIAAFCRAWNDSLPPADRTRLLLPYVRRVVGTRTTDADETTRAWLATDWLVRTCTPTWLRLAGLEPHATALESLPALTDATSAEAAQSTISAARDAARDARDAAGVAWAAARDAARDARDAAGAAWAAARHARDAAWATAWAAAWAAAQEDAQDAAGAAAQDAAQDAAWAAAQEAAQDAAWAAARAAAQDAARDAAQAAAWEALRPTVTALQLSACDLLNAMIAVGRTTTTEARNE